MTKTPIALNQTMQQIGEYGNYMNNKDWGEYSWRDKHQELFSEIIFDSLSVKSSLINVEINEEYKKNYDQSPALVDAVKSEKEHFDKVVGLGKEAVLFISNEIATEIVVDKNGKIISYPDHGGYNG